MVMTSAVAQADQLLVSELNGLVRRANTQVLPFITSSAATPQEKLSLWREFRKTVDSVAPRIPAEESSEAIAAANRIAYLYNFIESSSKILPISAGQKL